MVTIKDIAKSAVVAQGTVSNVLNGKGNVSSKKIKLVTARIIMPELRNKWQTQQNKQVKLLQQQLQQKAQKPLQMRLLQQSKPELKAEKLLQR